MPTSELAQLLTTAEQCSPEHFPDQAVNLNQPILALDPTNAAAHVRLARTYQDQRKFAGAKAACQEALRLNPQSAVAQRRLQRISEEWALAKQAQSVSTWDAAFQRGIEQKADDYAGLAIAYLWRAVELSRDRWQSVACRTALGAAYRARKDPLSLERAAAQYELILQHVLDDLPAKNGLAAVLRDQGELSQARRLYEQILAVAPCDAHVAFRAGRSAARPGRCGGRAATLHAKREAIPGASSAAVHALSRSGHPQGSAFLPFPTN